MRRAGSRSRDNSTRVTVSVLSDSNVAITERAALIETLQLPVPEQAPDQPTNVEPVLVATVSVTDVPWV